MWCLLWGLLNAVWAEDGGLEFDLGRREIRIVSQAFKLFPGRTVTEIRLTERLNRLQYKRVHDKPRVPGTFFWGYETFWIYQRSHRHRGEWVGARCFGLRLNREDGLIMSSVDEGGGDRERGFEGLYLEPESLAEDFDGHRAPRVEIRLELLPERAWRPLLAAEDARFFDHRGVDGRALARSTLANIRARRVVQGGSTLTQQLIKNRDLTPKRSLTRKASEAVRALALEAEYDKEEILECYLNHVYMGHLQGVAVYGFGTAAQAYFSRPLAELSWHETATLAAMVQGPNRLAPHRHPDALKRRRDWVLTRLETLGWLDSSSASQARNRPLKVNLGPPTRRPLAPFLAWIEAWVEHEAPRRARKDLGVYVETTLDPLLQSWAEHCVDRSLRGLEGRFPELRGQGLNMALVALDGDSGAVLAYVAGDPRNPDDQFDRVLKASRQPGSAIKPLLLLEAFSRAPGRRVFHAATVILDEPLSMELPTGTWEPQNHDGRFRGVVTVRQALRQSLNVPFVRLGMACGLDRVAERWRKCGVSVPQPLPAMLLGAVELSPIQLASAYTAFTASGKVLAPNPIHRLEKPGGRRLERFKVRGTQVASPAVAFIIRQLLMDVVELGSGRSARITDAVVGGKTGTSSQQRDAWFVGFADGVVAAVWVGLDQEGGLPVGGGAVAAPAWKRFMEVARTCLPYEAVAVPRNVSRHWVDPKTGLRLAKEKPGAVLEWFRHGTKPRTDRWWRRGRPERPLR